MSKFSAQLKMLRSQKGVTQVQLAKALGISKGTIAMWETGKRETNFDMLIALSRYFGTTIDVILGNDAAVIGKKKRRWQWWTNRVS